MHLQSTREFFLYRSWKWMFLTLQWIMECRGNMWDAKTGNSGTQLWTHLIRDVINVSGDINDPWECTSSTADMFCMHVVEITKVLYIGSCYRRNVIVWISWGTSAENSLVDVDYRTNCGKGSFCPWTKPLVVGCDDENVIPILWRHGFGSL
jgi:hypothetical protein